MNNGTAEQFIKLDKKTGAVSACRSEEKNRGLDKTHTRNKKSKNEGKF